MPALARDRFYHAAGTNALISRFHRGNGFQVVAALAFARSAGAQALDDVALRGAHAVAAIALLNRIVPNDGAAAQQVAGGGKQKRAALAFEAGIAHGGPIGVRVQEAM